MNNALMTKKVAFEVNGEEVELTGATVKNYLVRGNGDISDQELVMFINLCKYQKLNPFLNEAYLVKFGTQAAQIIVSKEAFMKRAEKHPQYAGFKAGIIVERNDQMVEIEGAIKLSKDILIGGWAEIYRKDRENPVTVKISLDEFSKGQATWKQMPLTMIRKSALVNAQREAFPESLGALYTEDDAEVATTPETAAKREIQQNANTEDLDFEEESNVVEADFEDIPEEPSAKESEAQESLFSQESPDF